jgi:uncharacterized DUF497 family protein
MIFEWDDDKNKMNIEKHGLSFEAAPFVFGGFYLSRPDDRKDYGEKRYCGMGTLGPDGRVVIIAYTMRGKRIRLISMRKANKREQNIFYSAVKHEEEEI